MSTARSLPLLVVIGFIAFMWITASLSNHKGDSQNNRDLSTTYPKTAYQALFEQKSDKGEARVVLSSDGKGHTRLKEQAKIIDYQHENVTKNQPTQSIKVDVARITLMDYINGKKYVVFEHNKSYQESDLSNLGVDIFDEEMFRSTKAKNLGKKEVNGVMAQGWLTTFPLTDAEQIEAWFNTKTGCLVHARGNGVETVLVKYQPGSLPPEAFLPPPTYKKSKV